MLAVGRIAAQNLLATDTPIGKLRGRVHAFGLQKIPLVVTYHPAYLLRSPTEKRKAWEDLKFARRVATGGSAVSAVSPSAPPEVLIRDMGPDDVRDGRRRGEPVLRFSVE